MKLFASIIVAFTLSCGLLFGQSAAEKVESYMAEKDYENAAKYIPDAVKEKKKDLDFHLFCGDIYFELGNYQKAYEMYEEADDIDGNEPPVLRKMGKALSYLGKHKEAYKILLDAVDRGKDDPSNHLALGAAYIRAKDLKNAELVIVRARGMNDENPDAFIALGDLYFARKIYALAQTNYEEALALNKDLIEAREKLAICYYWLANGELDGDLANELFKKSLSEWNIITKENPKNARAFYEQGKILYYSKQHKAAALSLYKHIQMRPSNSIARWWLAQSLYEVGQCDSAAPHLEIAGREIDSIRIKSKLLLARCFAENKIYPKSVSSYDEVVKSTKLEAKDMINYGRAALFSGDTTKAFRVWTEAIEMYPASSKICQVMFLAGTQANRMKDYTKAIYFLKKRVESAKCDDKYSPNANFSLGTAIFLNKTADTVVANRAQEAMPYFKKAIELKPTFLWAYNYLADVYAAIGQVDSCIATFTYVAQESQRRVDSITTAFGEVKTPEDSLKLIKLTRRDISPAATSYFKLASLYLEKKQYKDLVAITGKWAALKPNLPYPFLFQAFGYQGQGAAFKGRACSSYRKVLKIDPKNKAALKNLKALGC